MSGPIVRTGTTPKFWENYDNIFSKGKGAKKGGKSGSEASQAKKPASDSKKK